MSSSPPLYEDYSPSGSQDRSDRETSSDDHKYKRRRLEPESSPQKSMADPSRSSSGLPVTPGQPYPHIHTQPSYQPQFLGLASDTFQHFPIGAGGLWPEDAALEYLASGSGFTHDLRGIVPPPHAYNYHGFASTHPPRPGDLTSHPAHPPSRPDPRDSWFRAVPDEFQHVDLSDERLRDFASHVADSGRYMVVGHISRNPLPSSEAGRPSQPPYQSHESLPHRRAPSTASTKPATMLVLSRATAESIEALEEHKRECPACQLEFEPDNYMALITCCDTAMHVTCLSAWVNSQTYSKSRTCMKCRRTIDARRMLNNVVPPVSDKNWDESAEFNAPESLKGDAKIELNVTARPERDRAAYRRMRNSEYYASYRSRQPPSVPDQLSPETKRAMSKLRYEQLQESDELRRRASAAYTESTRTLDEDVIANRVLADAQNDFSRGVSVDLAPLLCRCEETKLAKDKAKETYQKLQIELETMQRVHSHRFSVMVEEAWVEQYRARTVVEGTARSPPHATESTGGRPAMSTSP